MEKGEYPMLDNLISAAKEKENKARIVVTHAIDESVFEAALQAMERELASFIFVGPTDVMTEIVNRFNTFQNYKNQYEFIHADNDLAAADAAVKLIKDGKGNVLMKGMLSTSVLLKAVLHKEKGLRTGRILSHVSGFSIPNRKKLLFLTDCAMNISPQLSEKKEIIENAVDAVLNMGISLPRVAVLAAIENVNPAMVATLDAAALTQMNRRGQIKNCIVDGPLAFDIALSSDAAHQKGIQSEVAGHADILLVPTIEVGNSLYKSLTLFGQALVGGVLVGAKSPIVLTSRADSVESKLFSMAMAVNMSNAN